MLPLGKKLFDALKAKISNYVFEVICDVSTFILLAVSLMYVVTSTYNPFIYFQF